MSRIRIPRDKTLLEILGSLLVLCAVLIVLDAVIPADVTRAYFGIPYGAVWGNLLASVICVGLALFRIRARLIAQHAAAMAQGRRQHAERMTQAAAHHSAAMQQAAAHHEEAMRIAGDRHQAVLAQLAASSSPE